MRYYASLNAENICTGVSQLKNDTVLENAVALDSYDTSVLGKKYINGVWEEVRAEEPEIPEEPEISEEPEIPPEPEIPEDPKPTQLDNIEATQLTIMTAMAEQYEESLERELINMEVQATIYEAILELGGAE